MPDMTLRASRARARSGGPYRLRELTDDWLLQRYSPTLAKAYAQALRLRRLLMQSATMQRGEAP